MTKPKSKVTAEEVRAACKGAKEDLAKVQRNLQEAIQLIERSESDVSFAMRDSLVALVKTLSEKNPKAVAESLVKVVRGRLVTRAGE
jgi:hypothetical protein